MRTWFYRALGLIPRREPLFDFTIVNGKRIDFDRPLTVWQAIARINEQR